MWESEIASVASKTDPVTVVDNGFEVNDFVKCSLIVWTEHCTECTYPTCYSTCSLYDPRIDQHCRSIKNGMQPVRLLNNYKEAAIRVEPKEWATMDALLGLKQHKKKKIERIEKFLNLVSYALAALGKRINKKNTLLRAFQHYRTKYFNSLSDPAESLPDIFLLQVYNELDKSSKIVISVQNFPRQQTTRNFQMNIRLEPGSNEVLIPFVNIASFLDLSKPVRAYISFDRKENSKLLFNEANFVTLSADRRSTLLKPNIKCVIWDLDNTLWSGTLIEGKDVVLNQSVVEIIREFDKKGILNCIASKNNHDDALRKLTEFGIDDLFLEMQINWDPKSKNIRTIISNLNIGADTFAFVDDNEFELLEVSESITEIEVVDVRNISSLHNHWRFQGGTSEDASKRRYFYQTESKRRNMEEHHEGSYHDFLRSCNFVIRASKPESKDFVRLHELIQRTNQLNFTGRRYAEDDVKGLLARQDLNCLLLKCADKFGDYGTVGFCIYEEINNYLLVSEFTLSCRVQAKRVEHMFFKQLLLHYFQKKNICTLKIRFKYTGKNTPAKNVLESMLPTSIENSNNMQTYVYNNEGSNFGEDVASMELNL